jgi:LysR family glycine cleavage system transcriptional activator
MTLSEFNSTLRCHRLPSLRSLQTFEAAARLQSFKSAARELSVSESAVSRQIRNLELEIGLPLFVRTHRTIALTETGESLAQGVRESFDRIHETISFVVKDTSVLKVKTLPTVGIRWLLPKIATYKDQSADTQIDIAIDSIHVDFKTEDYDAALVYGYVPPKTCEAHFLFDETVQPFAAPEFLRLHKGRALEEVALLRNTAEGREWRQWFSANGMQYPKRTRAIGLDTDELAVQAALRGYGVGLFDPRFIDDEIQSGRLVPLEEGIPVVLGQYFLVYPRGRASQRPFRRFRDFLLNQIIPQQSAGRELNAGSTGSVQNAA